MIKGVHQLTLRPNLLISLIDHFTIFKGWMDSQADPCVELGIFVTGGGIRGPGPTARIQDPHMGHTHAQAHECSCTGRQIDIHVHV